MPRLIAILLGAGITCANALEIQRYTGDHLQPADSNITNATLILAENIELQGAAQDDLFLLATGGAWLSRNKQVGRVLLDGVYGNDLWVWGGNVTLRGQVRDHARLGGFSVTVHGGISNQAWLAANNVHLTRTATLNDGAVILAENVICEGNIHGNLRVLGGSVTLAGVFEGDLHVRARDLALLSGTIIAGNLIYQTPKRVTIPNTVTVRGEVKRLTPKSPSKLRAALPGLLWSLSSTLCAGLLWVVFMPGFMEAAAHQARRRPGRAAVTGVVFMLCLPAALVGLIFSLVGIPAALLLGALSAVTVYLGRIVIATALGALLMPLAGAPASRLALTRKFILGTLILHLATFPVTALPVWILSATLGAGALLRVVIEGGAHLRAKSM